MTPQLACRELVKAGLDLRPEQVRVEAREERWVVHLPGQQLAWFAGSNEGLMRLRVERRVLRLLEARCTFGAPRVIFEDRAGEFDVRTMVSGASDAWQAYTRVRDDADLAARVGASLGAMLVEQHSRIVAADVADWLPRHPSWPCSREWVGERLVRVVDDRELIASADAVMRACDEVAVATSDFAMVHTDIGFHNMGVDSSSYEVRGLFDYHEAAWADRHHDFRYFLLDLEQERDEMLNAAVSVYEPRTGYKIERQRVALYHAACAISFLAYRIGTSPGELSCGRTLEQDLSWSRLAIRRVLGPSRS